MTDNSSRLSVGVDRLARRFGQRRERYFARRARIAQALGRARDLQFVAENDILTKQVTRIYVVVRFCTSFACPSALGGKDESDDLDKISGHVCRAYPKDKSSSRRRKAVLCKTAPRSCRPKCRRRDSLFRAHSLFRSRAQGTPLTMRLSSCDRLRNPRRCATVSRRTRRLELLCRPARRSRTAPRLSTRGGETTCEMLIRTS